MKIDHIVVNIDSKYQNNVKEISEIRSSGLLYEPKYGKRTSGFKVSNIWIGKEYFELLNLLNKDGGGWKKDWIELYNDGHRGVICIFFDIDNIEEKYDELRGKGIQISKPEWLKFKWFFNLFTRTMPWKNSYLPFFEKLPLQFGFQQMKDEKSKKFMEEYMYPNSNNNGIDKISCIEIFGEYTEKDFILLSILLPNSVSIDSSSTEFIINENQKIRLVRSKFDKTIIYCDTTNEEFKGNKIKIENTTIELV